MFKRTFIILAIFLSFIYKIVCNIQYGPDPWHYESSVIHKSESNIPRNLQHLPLTNPRTEADFAQNDWFLKRIIAILLKNGRVKRNEDEKTIEIEMRMKFSENQWNLLNDYTQYTEILTDEMLRRIIGYVEEAIYKPTITEKIAEAWSDYIQIYLSFYKVEIVLTLGVISILMTVWYLYHNMSSKNVIVLLFFGIYGYEVWISYMEVEKQEHEIFMNALNKCKWYFWSSTCDLPKPDPLVLLKQMHPLKIGIRIITTFITEPMINISSFTQTAIHQLTGDLWYPLNAIVYGILIVIVHVILVIFIIMILFNFMLNIPFNLSFCAGLVNIGLRERKRHISTEIPTLPSDINSNHDRLSGKNLDKLFKIFDQCTNNINKSENHINPHVASTSYVNENSPHSSLKRSSSTSRLTEFVRFPCNTDERITPYVRKGTKNCGSGDN